MFETYFGFSGPPFQLSPDPSFYFDSRGHANALAYLKFGVYQGEGFIVVTGEVGAGKTTLARALLGSLNPEQVIAAQVVSTQLESGDLLRAITAAFGVAPAGRGKADLILSLESFLTALATTNRRALLIVDEAQNLSIEAIEELRMLSNFQLGNRALLQSFLVGQPELRTMLESTSMEQFRQRVIASCHLGPLDPGETRAYIEHRLRRVGWHEMPAFEGDAFDEIHIVSGGIPRRINQLCNRLLLAAFLGPIAVLSRSEVKRIAREMQVEVGEHPAQRKTAASQPPRPRPSRTAHQWAHDEAQTASISTDTGVVQIVNQRGLNLDRPILCIAGSAASFAMIGALSRSIAECPDLPQIVAVNPGESHTVALGDDSLADRVCPPMELHLGATKLADSISGMAALAPRIESMVSDMAPRALLTLDDDEASLVAALIARAQGVPLLRLRAGRRNGPGTSGVPYGALIDRLSVVHYTENKHDAQVLQQEGLGADQPVSVGSLTGTLLRVLRPYLPPAASVLARQGVARVAPRRFVLVVAQYGLADDGGTERHELAALISALGRREPTIWLVTESCMAALLAHGMYGRVQADGVVLLPAAGYLESLALLNGAGCLVRGGDDRLVEEAEMLGVPSVMLRTSASFADASPSTSGITIARSAEQATVAVEAILGFNPSGPRPEPTKEDAAGRVAAHLRSWFGSKASREPRPSVETVIPL